MNETSQLTPNDLIAVLNRERSYYGAAISERGAYCICFGPGIPFFKGAVTAIIEGLGLQPIETDPAAIPRFEHTGDDPISEYFDELEKNDLRYMTGDAHYVVWVVDKTLVTEAIEFMIAIDAPIVATAPIRKRLDEMVAKLSHSQS